MLPSIFLYTNEEDYIYFSAPYISKSAPPHMRIKCITPPATNPSFPLPQKETGYKIFTKIVVVHIRDRE